MEEWERRLRTFQRAVSPAVCFLLSSLPFLAIQLRPKSLPDAASFLLWTVLVITAASGVVAIGFLSTFLLMCDLLRSLPPCIRTRSLGHLRSRYYS